MILFIDHYDSFSDMLCDYISQLGFDIMLIKSNLICLEDIIKTNPSHIIIGPGPGHPSDLSLKSIYTLLNYFEKSKPILGICLGHQIIAQKYGASVIHSKKIMHGKVSKIRHNNNKLFRSIPKEYNVTRYHSFMICNNNVPSSIEVIATSCDEIMAIRHRSLKIWGVQFHPEAIQTEYGLDLLNNFLND